MLSLRLISMKGMSCLFRARLGVALHAVRLRIDSHRMLDREISVSHGRHRCTYSLGTGGSDLRLVGANSLAVVGRDTGTVWSSSRRRTSLA